MPIEVTIRFQGLILSKTYTVFAPNSQLKLYLSFLKHKYVKKKNLKTRPSNLQKYDF